MEPPVDNHTDFMQHVWDLEKQNADLVAALERAEQTIRNLGNGVLTGDAKQIALNEAANLRDDITKAGKD